MLERIPDELALHRQIDLLPNTDRFGKRMSSLIRDVEEHERSGNLEGFARWLLMYERGRRTIKLHNTNHEKGVHNYLKSPITYRHRLVEKFYPVGKHVIFDDFLRVIKNRRVVIDKGSYRQIPTSSVMDYLYFNMSFKIPNRIRTIFFEPKENIQRYKGDLPVLPDLVRAEFLRHIPGIDYVIRVPGFEGKPVDTFWSDMNERMSRVADEVIEIVELGDPMMQSKIFNWNNIFGRGFVRPSFQIENVSRFGLGNYYEWRTGDWEKRTRGFDHFVRLAEEHLIDK